MRASARTEARARPRGDSLTVKIIALLMVAADALLTQASMLGAPAAAMASTPSSAKTIACVTKMPVPASQRVSAKEAKRLEVAVHELGVEGLAVSTGVRHSSQTLAINPCLHATLPPCNVG